MKNIAMRRFHDFLDKVNEQEDIDTDMVPTDAETEVDMEIAPVGEEPKLLGASAEGGTASADEHIRALVEFQVQVKAMHWATESFAQHKATCDTYAALDAAIDALVESHQGHSGRIRIGGQYTILNFEDINFDPWLSSAMEHVNALRGIITQSDVLNLLDEILAILSKFKYLLTLK